MILSDMRFGVHRLSLFLLLTSIVHIFSFQLVAAQDAMQDAMQDAGQAAGQATGGFETSAPYAVIMDYDTGLVLFEKNAREPIGPSSMTKIMTADMVFERLSSGGLKPDTKFKVSPDAWKRGGGQSGSSTMFLEPGSEVGVMDLLRGVIIQSGNDACIVLAEGLAGSESAFADLMTARAHELGLTSASFKNATGWPHPDHKISLYDLARLGRHTIASYREYYPIYAEPNFTWNKITQVNRNPILGLFPGADGIKTGHTEAAGYGFIGSAERVGIRRIIVINGLPSKSARKNESLRLMQAAYEQFKIYALFDAATPVVSVPVYMGRKDSVDAITDRDIKTGLYRGVRQDMKVSVKRREAIAAPVKAGDQIAELIISAPGLENQTYPLYASRDVGRRSALSRIMAYIAGKLNF